MSSIVPSGPNPGHRTLKQGGLTHRGHANIAAQVAAGRARDRSLAFRGLIAVASFVVAVMVWMMDNLQATLLVAIGVDFLAITNIWVALGPRHELFDADHARQYARLTNRRGFNAARRERELRMVVLSRRIELDRRSRGRANLVRAAVASTACVIVLLAVVRPINALAIGGRPSLLTWDVARGLLVVWAFAACVSYGIGMSTVTRWTRYVVARERWSVYWRVWLTRSCVLAYWVATLLLAAVVAGDVRAAIGPIALTIVYPTALWSILAWTRTHQSPRILCWFARPVWDGVLAALAESDACIKDDLSLVEKRRRASLGQMADDLTRVAELIGAKGFSQMAP